jgi:hypothetical protein
MANWFECIRERKQPNAPVEIGYKSADCGAHGESALPAEETDHAG